MRTPDDPVEVKQGTLLVNREAVPLRKGIIYAALARAGWDGTEGPVGRDFFERLLRADPRLSIFVHAPA